MRGCLSPSGHVRHSAQVCTDTTLQWCIIMVYTLQVVRSWMIDGWFHSLNRLPQHSRWHNDKNAETCLNRLYFPNMVKGYHGLLGSLNNILTSRPLEANLFLTFHRFAQQSRCGRKWPEVACLNLWGDNCTSVIVYTSANFKVVS